MKTKSKARPWKPKNVLLGRYDAAIQDRVDDMDAACVAVRPILAGGSLSAGPILDGSLIIATPRAVVSPYKKAWDYVDFEDRLPRVCIYVGGAEPERGWVVPDEGGFYAMWSDKEGWHGGFFRRAVQASLVRCFWECEDGDVAVVARMVVRHRSRATPKGEQRWWASSRDLLVAHDRFVARYGEESLGTMWK